MRIDDTTVAEAGVAPRVTLMDTEVVGPQSRSLRYHILLGPANAAKIIGRIPASALAEAEVLPIRWNYQCSRTRSGALDRCLRRTAAVAADRPRIGWR